MRHERLKWAGVLIVALILPACAGEKRVGSTLFSETFDNAFPGTRWTAPVITGSATAAADTGIGFAAPSLKMTTTAATASARTTATTAFNNPPVTFSVTMADLSAATTDAGTGTITILDSTPAVLASASWDNTTGRITFHILGGVDVQSIVLPADGAFHRIVFSVSAAGVGTWSLDSGPALVNQAVAAGMLTLELGATFGAGTAWPSFFFDNVSVTSP